MAILSEDFIYLINRMNAVAFYVQLGTLLEQIAISASVLITDVPCDTACAVGDWVYLDSTGKAFQALADSLANSNVFGVIEVKSDPAICDIRVLGVSEEIFAGLDPTANYFLSPTVPGGMTNTPPVASGEVMLRLGQAFSSTKFFVNKSERIVRA